MGFGSSIRAAAPQCGAGEVLAVDTVDAVVAEHGPLLARIKLCFGADRATFERELMPLVHGYARYVHRLPATPNGFFAHPGGLLHLGLETAFYALQGTDAHIFTGRATITERAELEPRWRLATFIGGLCGELHRALSPAMVTAPDGTPWPALRGPLADWMAAQQLNQYVVHWRRDAVEARGMGLFALPHVVPAAVLAYLDQAHSSILSHLLASVGGISRPGEHNMLDSLVRRSLALVVHRDLVRRSDGQVSGALADHLARYLLLAMRQLAAAHAGWTPNADKSRVWWAADGLFLAWPGAATDVLQRLEGEQWAGMPSSTGDVLRILVAAGVCVARSADDPTWTIHPPGMRSPVDGIKLSSPALLLAGLAPDMEPLAHPLAVRPTVIRSAPPDTEVPPASTSPETGSQSEGHGHSAAGGAPEPARQLSLLDDPSRASPVPPDVDHAQSGTLPTPSGPRLIAPLRLHPAVRAALQAAITQPASAGGPPTLQAASGGVFVPFATFQQRGVQPALAVRALEEAGMLLRPSTVRDPAGQTPSNEPTIPGVLVQAAFFEGLDRGNRSLPESTVSPAATTTPTA